VTEEVGYIHRCEECSNMNIDKLKFHRGFCSKITHNDKRGRKIPKNQLIPRWCPLPKKEAADEEER
jgi:hypothetical protein